MNNIIQFKNINTNQFVEHNKDDKDNKVDEIDEILVKSNVINNPYIINRIGEFKIVTFYNKDNIIQYEKKECGDKSNNVYGSWLSCKEKFDVFPCKIACRYIKLGDEEGYIAIYMTLEEYKKDLQNSLKQLKSI